MGGRYQRHGRHRSLCPGTAKRSDDYGRSQTEGLGVRGRCVYPEEVSEMKIEEAIVYLLAGEGHGMTTDTLAEQINLRRLHLRRDGQPVTSNQVYAVAMRFPEMFVKDERLIRLMV